MRISNSSQKFTARARVLAAMLALVIMAFTGGVYAEGSFPKVLPLPNGFAPEGIATGRGTDFYVGSLAGGAIYKGDLRTGQGDIFVPAASRAITGLKVDSRTGYVFASGAASGRAFVFDGASGAQLEEYVLTTSAETFINDVVITRDAAYFTDSRQPLLYRVPLGPRGQLPQQIDITEIELGGDFVFVPGAFNANGIEATSNGGTLIIVSSTLGVLYSVDPGSGEATLIDLGGGSVPNGDGILLHGHTLYVVQNRLNKIAVIDLDLASNSGEIVDEITDPLFRVPTTVAQFGSLLYAVNARFGTPATPDTEYEAIQVVR